VQRLRRVGLTPRQTLCLAMWCFDGLAYWEIAAELNICAGTVRQHIYRAKHRLLARGMEPRRLERQEPAWLETMDPHRMDRLRDEQITARW
jgi:DNA-binding NarL/FixJ family response regulator